MLIQAPRILAVQASVLYPISVLPVFVACHQQKTATTVLIMILMAIQIVLILIAQAKLMALVDSVVRVQLGQALVIVAPAKIVLSMSVAMLQQKDVPLSQPMKARTVLVSVRNVQVVLAPPERLVTMLNVLLLVRLVMAQLVIPVPRMPGMVCRILVVQASVLHLMSVQLAFVAYHMKTATTVLIMI
jgi:hypothetical protein